MKQKSELSRYSLLLAILICYLAPLLGLSLYGALVPREMSDWNILSLGFLLTSCGSVILFWMMSSWEDSLNLKDRSHAKESENDLKRSEVNLAEYDLAKRSLAEAQQTQIHLLSEIDLLTEQMQNLSLANKKMTLQSEKMQMEMDQTKRTAKHQLDLQQNQIRELKELVAEQKAFSEKKQQHMLHLETKVGDLTQEIKTLLQVNEMESSSSNSKSEDYPTFEKNLYETLHEYPSEIKNSDDEDQEASKQLQMCLDIAQKIKGSQRFGSQIYSFLESPADNFSLDLRRLCDRLRSEAQSSILLYSPKDNHLLFVSNQIKLLTGWSPDKFMQNFSEILDEADWKHGVSGLAMNSEVQIKLRLKTKSSHDRLVNANLGMITNGIFRNHVIAVLSFKKYS